jgi:indolepyruvate ferredoxin oxidoreductase beta subunit
MRLEEDPINIVITGVGGQGNVVASQIVARAAINEGFYVTIGETYGASQRGGAVMSHVRLSEKTQYGPLIPEGRAHIILGFEPIEALRVMAAFGNQKTRVIVNKRPYYPIDVLTGRLQYPKVDDVLAAIKSMSGEMKTVESTEIAKKAGDVVMQNVVMVGCLAGSGWIVVNMQSFRKALEETFPKKTEENLRAFEMGVEGIKKAKEVR